jgi:hypothetical protein
MTTASAEGKTAAEGKAAAEASAAAKNKDVAEAKAVAELPLRSFQLHQLPLPPFSSTPTSSFADDAEQEECNGSSMMSQNFRAHSHSPPPPAPRASVAAHDVPPSKTKLYIAIKGKTPDAQIKAILDRASSYGRCSHDGKLCNKNGQAFIFVEFTSERNASQAQAGMDSLKLSECTLSVEFARGKVTSSLDGQPHGRSASPTPNHVLQQQQQHHQHQHRQQQQQLQSSSSQRHNSQARPSVQIYQAPAARATHPAAAADSSHSPPPHSAGASQSPITDTFVRGSFPTRGRGGSRGPASPS